MNRREFLIGLGALSVGVAGCGKPARQLAARHAPYTGPAPTLPDADLRVLHRTSFGPNRETIQQIQQMGRGAYVDRVLAANDPEDDALGMQLVRLEALHMQAAELQDQPQHEVISQIQSASILRATYGKNPLLERMVSVWTDHFNIDAKKEYSAYRKPQDEDRVIREHALGKFPDMLLASTQSPAMLVYLDNQLNRRGVPNENYARELLELHSMGVHGGYTQRDILEVARCFTGWTVERRFLHARGQLRFDPALHDDGAKTVLGVHIPAGGRESDARRVVSILSNHPATARNIATKLCRAVFGVATAEWVARTAGIYLETGGDIRSMLRPMLMSEDLLTAPPMVKRPMDFLISALRCSEAVTDGARPLQQWLRTMGQSPYEWPMPDGYPTDLDAWTGSLLARWNFASALCANGIAGTSVNWRRLGLIDQPQELVPTLLGRSRDAARPLDKSLDLTKAADLNAALCLMSPEFQWR
ncbi:MAG: DUF1800 domain-containing protein [Chthonomonas sp.]|nr:DUF1800 domain-containing protein [Chthonomonas sp.]